jgi:hypothetical protein
VLCAVGSHEEGFGSRSWFHLQIMQEQLAKGLAQLRVAWLKGE